MPQFMLGSLTVSQDKPLELLQLHFYWLDGLPGIKSMA